MRHPDASTFTFAAVVAALALAVTAAHRATIPHPAPLHSSLPAAELAAQRVDEQYRRSASAVAPSYENIVVAGSGAAGARDGVGLYAQFVDPVDLSLTPNGARLLVLDAGAVREIDLETRAVNTVLTLETLVPFLPTSVRSFTRIVSIGDGVLLYAESANVLIHVRDRQPSVVTPGPGAISDLVYAQGRVLALERGSGRVLAATSSDWKWQTVATFRSGPFDVLSADGNRLVAMSRATGASAEFDLAANAPVLRSRTVAGVEQIVFDAAHSRHLIVQSGRLAFIDRAGSPSGRPIPFELWNIQGKRLGRSDAPVGYQAGWFGPRIRVAIDETRNLLYIIDRDNRRVLRILNSSVGWRQEEGAGNPRGYRSPDYSTQKSAGTTRILWLSHSVFWYPAGIESGNLALGAPRQLELLLNTTSPEAGQWQVVNPAIGGTDFFTTVYSRARDALATYGLDYAVVVIDLQNLYWFLKFQGWRVPPAYDADGMPVGVDAELAEQAPLDRRYPEPLRPLAEHIATKLRAPSASVPLIDEKGEIVDGTFFRIWSGDATFRTLLIDVYVKLLAGLERACAAAGVKLIVFIAPTSNFIAQNEWFDAYAIGGAEQPYDFEAVHRPILERLWSAAIPSYDLTYDMLARHPRLFPFNAASHHRSDLFHRAVAESIVAAARRFNLFSFAPAASRSPLGTPPAAAPQSDVVITPRDNVCFVLHDLWNARATSQTPRFADLLALGVADVERAAADRALACAEYRLSFVYIKNRDDYGIRDFRRIDAIASMTIAVEQLASIRASMETSGANVDLERSVQFRWESRQ